MSQLRSFATSRFWKLYRDLPSEIRLLASEKYNLFKQDPFHPSLGFQSKGAVWTVNIGRSYRAIARRKGDDVYWFWIGSHEDYNKVLKRMM